MPRHVLFCLSIFVMSLLAREAFSLEVQSEFGEELAASHKMRRLSLDECIRFSIYNSFEVKLAKLDYLIAETKELYSKAVFDTFLSGDASYAVDKRQQISVFAPDKTQTNTYSLGFEKEFPTGTELDVSWGDERGWNNSAFVTMNPAHTAELRFDVEQPVGKNFFGYIDRNTITVTKLAVKNANLEMQDEIEKLIADTEKLYWETVYAERIFEIHIDILQRARELHAVNAKNYDMGLIEKGDFYASEANVRIQETNFFLAENKYKNAEDNLKLLINMTDPAWLVPEDKFHYKKMEYALVECFKKAFEKNRKYKIGKREIDIKQINLRMKENNIWPEIDITASMAMNGVDEKFDNAFGRTTVVDNTYYYAGIEFSVPLENSKAESEHIKAVYEREKAIVELKQTERTIITDVGNFYRDLATYSANTLNISEAVRLQSEKLKEEIKRFKYGRSNTKRLIDYQNDLLLTQIEEARVLLNREKSRVDLEKVMNVLLDKYERVI